MLPSTEAQTATSPGAEAPPTPAQPTSAQVPIEPRTPVTAYCIPFIERRSTGCLLNVVQAAPGSILVFRLTTPVNESVNVVVTLEPSKTYGHLHYTLDSSLEEQANLTGTVEYEGHPEQTWPVTAADPHAVTHRPRDHMELNGVRWMVVSTVVHLGDGETIVMRALKLDPNQQSEHHHGDGHVYYPVRLD